MRLVRLPTAALVFGSAAFFGLSGRWPWPRLDSSAAPVVPVDTVPPVTFTETLDTLRRGETLSALFARNNVSIDFQRLESSLSLNPRRVRPGLVFRFRRQLGDSAPGQVQVRTTPDQRITLSRTTTGWDAEVHPVRWSAQEARIEGTIESSLYEALDAGVGDPRLDGENRRRLAWDLADVYAWAVDFTRDIRPGDRYRVIYERRVSEDGEVRFGKVLASDLMVSGKSLKAFRFGETTRRTALYYDEDGNSLRRAFLRAPVQFRRISSSFARRRYHPVLGFRRRHEGTDYAAAPGTPVMAAGDGIVLRAGRAGGYGNLVELRHFNGITTRYGHLRSFARNIRRGVRVEQGQTIGYVGSTGLATGPHLHYEFRMNGIPQDSRRVKLGNGSPVGAQDRQAFEQERNRLTALLRSSDTMFATSPLVNGQAAETLKRWLP